MQNSVGSLGHILSYWDLILTPVYFILLLIWVIRWKKKHYSNTPYKKYIVPAFIFKMFCCIILACLYEFYYGYSDAHNYYTGAVEIWSAFRAHYSLALELIFKPISECSDAAVEFGFHMSSPEFAASTDNMFKFSGFIGLFCFGTYMPIAMVITTLSFLGIWRFFLVFVEEFPAHYKKIALACLFAPSAVFWSTNIMKDPICVFGLGLCVTALYDFIKNRFTFSNLIGLALGSFLILSLKNYLFYMFVVAAACVLYSDFSKKYKGSFLKIVVNFLLFIGLCWSLIWLSLNGSVISETLVKGFEGNIELIQNIQSNSGGSVYTLSNVDDFSLPGIIRTYFISLNVALFRPYLWETPNVIALANAIESTIIMLLTFYLLIRSGIIGFFRFASQSRMLLFGLVFTLFLAPIAGLISFNFGTLIRYKMPAVPFFYTYLVLFYAWLHPKKKQSDAGPEKNVPLVFNQPEING